MLKTVPTPSFKNLVQGPCHLLDQLLKHVLSHISNPFAYLLYLSTVALILYHSDLSFFGGNQALSLNSSADSEGQDKFPLQLCRI